MTTRPNVIYINSHDTGRHIQPFGHSIPAPKLQALAEGGTLFRQTYCVNPTCSASRSGLLTGQYPHQNGMLGLAHRGFELSNKTQHLRCFLQEAGCHICLAGFQHVADDVRNFGFSQVYENLRLSDENAANVLENPPARNSMLWTRLTRRSIPLSIRRSTYPMFVESGTQNPA